jgi:hypothetical protein
MSDGRQRSESIAVDKARDCACNDAWTELIMAVGNGQPEIGANGAQGRDWSDSIEKKKGQASLAAKE